MLSVTTNDGGAGRWAKRDAKAQLSTSAAAERPLFDGMFISRFFLRSCTSHCARHNGTRRSASGWAQGRCILVTEPVIEANEDTPRWCATGCTVRYHPVRRALASILDASLSRLTEIPDDALQFDLVILSRHNHTLETAVGVKLKSG